MSEIGAGIREIYKKITTTSSTNLQPDPKKITKMSADRNRARRFCFRALLAMEAILSEIGRDSQRVLVLVNPSSGSHQGKNLMAKFEKLLGKDSICNLLEDKSSVHNALEKYRHIRNLRIIVCGGDGTVGWVLAELDKIDYGPDPNTWPAVATIPLGTGNDLSRTLGWGGAESERKAMQILKDVSRAEIVNMDRWSLRVTGENQDHINQKFNHQNPTPQADLPLKVFNNYLSVGMGAQIALEFERARLKSPWKFKSRCQNRWHYIWLSCKQPFKDDFRSLMSTLSIECDGVDYTEMLKKYQAREVVFLNISSYGGGAKPWSEKSTQGHQDLSDGLLEVIAFDAKDLACVEFGGKGRAIGQCKKATITLSQARPVQVDGEACLLKPCTITIEQDEKVGRTTARMLLKHGEPSWQATCCCLNCVGAQTRYPNRCTKKNCEICDRDQD